MCFTFLSVVKAAVPAHLAPHVRDLSVRGFLLQKRVESMGMAGFVISNADLLGSMSAKFEPERGQIFVEHDQIGNTLGSANEAT